MITVVQNIVNFSTRGIHFTDRINTSPGFLNISFTILNGIHVVGMFRISDYFCKTIAECFVSGKVFIGPLP